MLHRTAWAGVGNGVLFFDADGDGKISQDLEYIFTKWDPTATSDLEALRAAFDTNSDGKLTAADAAFASFKVEVSNADGSTSVMTLAQAGITPVVARSCNRKTSRCSKLGTQRRRRIRLACAPKKSFGNRLAA